jgi:protein SCO1
VKARNSWIFAGIAVVAGVAAGLLGSRVTGDSGGAPAERYAYRAAGDEAAQFWNVPEFAFPNQHSSRVESKQLRGHVWVADFMFTTCTSACPILTSKLVKLQRKITDPRMRFVSFSVDPAHDTEAALAAYAELWNPSETRWWLLRTEPRSLESLARDMRVAVEAKNDVRDPILHSSLFFLVDAEGAVRGIFDSNDDVALTRLVEQAHTLLGVAAPGPVNLGATAPAKMHALNCNACHGNPAIAPALGAPLGSVVKLADGTSVTLDRAYLRESLLAPGAKQVAGYLNLMPSYAEELDSAAVDDIVEHLAQHALPAETASAAVVAGSGGAPAALAHDPVCGMDVRVTPQTPHAQHAGRDTYFCSDACRAQFVADPSRYTP